jgi:hypothetical protein
MLGCCRDCQQPSFDLLVMLLKKKKKNSWHLANRSSVGRKLQTQHHMLQGYFPWVFFMGI